MKVLMLNGSPRVNGNTATALREMQKVFEANSIETELVQVGFSRTYGSGGEDLSW